jgi:hypothetical protein
LIGKNRASKASRLGAFLGRCLKGYLSQIAKLSNYLIRMGIPPRFARVCGWLFHTVLIITLLYITFWMTMIVILVFIGRCGLLSATAEPPGWRGGPEGFGFYENGVRTDFGRLFEDDQ